MAKEQKLVLGKIYPTPERAKSDYGGSGSLYSKSEFYLLEIPYASHSPKVELEKLLKAGWLLVRETPLQSYNAVPIGTDNFAVVIMVFEREKLECKSNEKEEQNKLEPA